MQVSPASVVACVEGALKGRQFRSERGKKRHNNTEGLDSLDPHSRHVLSSLLNKMPDIPNFPNISSDNYFEGSYKFQEPTHAEHALDNIYKMEMISAEHESIKRLPRDGVQDSDDEGDDGSSPREPDTTDEDWRLLKAAKKAQQKAQKINNEQVSKFQAQLNDTEKKITEGFNNATNKEDLEIYRNKLSKKLSELRQRTKKSENIQALLRRMGRCPYDYEWTKVAGGYRCEGGMHFVSDE